MMKSIMIMGKLKVPPFQCVTAFCIALFSSLIHSAPAYSQELRSTAPIKIIVPYGPGGPTDLVARILAPQLQNVLKQTVIVENRPGAGSVLGARVVAAAAPDGHTILLGNLSTYAVAPAIMKNPGYDPLQSFIPIVLTSDTNAVMVTNPGFPAKTFKEFIAYAIAHPGKISYGSAGVGNSAHLLGELLGASAKVAIMHVPYRSGAETATAVLSGQIEFAFIDLSASLGNIRQGKLIPLAVTGLSRSAELPDVPTLSESGYPDIVLRNWTGAAVPAGTPPAIVKKLVSAFSEVIKSPQYQEQIKKLYAEAKPGTSEEFATLIAAEYKKWSEIAKAAGVSLD